MTEPSEVGDEVELVATAMVAGGDALARLDDGRVVFITGALPDERVRVAVTEKRRDFLRGQTIAVVEPSSNRVAPPCPAVAAGCGGCQWQHVSVGGQRDLKEAVVVDALRRIGHIEDVDLRPTVTLPATGYRTTARMHVREGGRLGFRRFHGHDVVDASDCLIVHPGLADLIAVGRFPRAKDVTLRIGARTSERLTYADPSAADAVVPDDVVVTDRRRPGYYHEEAAGRRWRISARSFFQARPDGADALARVVGDAAGDGDGRTAIDLYAGVGLFAGVLVDRGWSVVAVEGNRGAAADARHNVRDARVVHADVTSWNPRPAAVVVADPSRAGLGVAGAAVVAGCHPETVVLVSCDPAALARDARLLSGHGFDLRAATLVDLFPHTFHIEVIGEFSRR